jgi:hypothetical protein
MTPGTIPIAEVNLQWQENVERFKAQGMTDPDEIERLAGQEIFECLARQRRYFEGALQRARNKVGAQGCFPNHRDYLTNVEMCYVQEAAMSFCQIIFPGDRLATIDDCGQRMVDAENGNSKMDREIDDLYDEIGSLKHELSRIRGGQN